MEKQYFNVKDFANYKGDFQKDYVSLNQNFSRSASYDSAHGKQPQYGVFLSHSTKDETLVRQIRAFIEDKLRVSAYIDWEEDNGVSRDEVAEKVKEAMTQSNKFIIVQTKNSDKSSWVSWETGFFDHKDSNSIGVLLVEEDNFTVKDFYHQEYLKNYTMLTKDDLKYFLEGGILAVSRYHKTREFDANFKKNNIGISTETGTVGIGIINGTGITTKFYGD